MRGDAAAESGVLMREATATTTGLLYAQDSFRITPRLTLNYGLRYEHYGVQHNNHQNLDSNFYFGPGSSFPERVRSGQVFLTQKSPIGQFWAPSWGTAAPRVGFAYDIFGDGKTSLRGGFGISYERNFGNVTYNASFNPPASAVIGQLWARLESYRCTTLATTSLWPSGRPRSLNLPPERPAAYARPEHQHGANSVLEPGTAAELARARCLNWVTAVRTGFTSMTSTTSTCTARPGLSGDPVVESRVPVY